MRNNLSFLPQFNQPVPDFLTTGVSFTYSDYMMGIVSSVSRDFPTFAEFTERYLQVIFINSLFELQENP